MRLKTFSIIQSKKKNIIYIYIFCCFIFLIFPREGSLNSRVFPERDWKLLTTSDEKIIIPIDPAPARHNHPPQSVWLTHLV